MSKKRSMNTQTLLDFDLEESSSDSDFRIEDHDDSDDFKSDDSGGGGSGSGSSDSDSDSDSTESQQQNKDTEKKDTDPASLANGAATNCGTKSPSRGHYTEPVKRLDLKLLQSIAPICCACLGDRSDDSNEIVECDNCGVTVHEGCYGVSESVSVSSTVSSCSTEPWFCEVCKAGVKEPSCELCPNKGGIFKETDVGKWVHLICALYVPGVAFGEVDQLSSVTLFEMPYNKWGTKTCSICDDARFARSGVCIGCDAGMCKTYFHVTCAQSMGLLSEPHSEEADHADPFYAHCKLHSDKTMLKHRKRNYNALQVRLEQKTLEHEAKRQEPEPSSEQQRVERKLKKHKKKYLSNKAIKVEPWVPTQKMPRLITTSASAIRRLLHKATLMGIDSEALEVQEAQMAALNDVRKKWHIQPAFSVEFIGYFLDRITRLRDIKSNLEVQVVSNAKLLSDQQYLKEKYDQMIRENEDLSKESDNLKEKIQMLHLSIFALCPNKPLPLVSAIGKPVAPTAVTLTVPPPASTPPARPMSVPTAAALKMGVGFPLQNSTTNNAGKILSTQRQDKNDLLHNCGICKRCTDQHMLAKCDTCHFHYHLGCLNPPLTRHPKKGKLYGWQCSECDNSDGSDKGVTMPEGPRKSRTRYSKDGIIVSANSRPETPVKIEVKVEEARGEAQPPPTAEVDTISALMAEGPELEPKVEEPVNESLPKVDPIIIPKMKITPTRGRGRGRGRGRPPGRKNFERASQPPVPETRADVQSPTSLPVSIPVVWPANSSPVVAAPTVQPVVPVESSSTPKTAKSEKRKAKKEKKHHHHKHQQPVYFIAPQPPPPPSTGGDAGPEEASSSSNNHNLHESTAPGVDDEEEEEEEEDEDEEDETNESIVDKNLMNLSHEMAQSNAADSSAMNTTHELDEEKAIHHRKKKNKEKHKNKTHDLDPSKGHKRKRKRKYGMENTTEVIADDQGASHPRIKIRFKAIPIPGSSAEPAHDAEKQFVYLPPEDALLTSPKRTKSPHKMKSPRDSMPGTPTKQMESSPVHDRRSLTSPTTPRRSSSVSATQTPSQSSTPTLGRKRKRDTQSSTPTIDRIQHCDVCHLEGNAQNLVKCDECKKNYHFTCLDPPLKKTPKKRGYSWHCADCDPTDKENN